MSGMFREHHVYYCRNIVIVPIRLFGGKKGFAVLRILSILHEIIFLIEWYWTPMIASGIKNN